MAPAGPDHWGKTQGHLPFNKDCCNEARFNREQTGPGRMGPVPCSFQWWAPESISSSIYRFQQTQLGFTGSGLIVSEGFSSSLSLSLFHSHSIKHSTSPPTQLSKLLLTYENSMQRMEWADCHGDKNGMFVLIYFMASRLLAASVFFARQLDCLFQNMTGLAPSLLSEPRWWLNR